MLVAGDDQAAESAGGVFGDDVAGGLDDRDGALVFTSPVTGQDVVAVSHRSSIASLLWASTSVDGAAYDIGDSWLKTQGLGGHDIQAICVTKKGSGDCSLAPQSTKPRFSMIAQIHAREIATGEIAWQFIDYLTAGYGSNARVTALLDSTEVWIVPIANPDGVDIVASGGNRPRLQRKNAHTGGGCTGTSIGVDLNRNSTYHWGEASTYQCSQTYQGTSSGSEPEV